MTMTDLSCLHLSCLAARSRGSSNDEIAVANQIHPINVCYVLAEAIFALDAMTLAHAIAIAIRRRLI